MEAILLGVASAALSEGVKFLYAQAAEVLSAWRRRRREPDAPAPAALEPPAGVTMTGARPSPDPASPEIAETLQELKDLVEPIKDGEVPADSPEARRAVAALRELLESVLGGPITLAGEEPRTLDVAGVNVTVQNVAAKVTGLRADLDKLRGRTTVRDVRVTGGDVTAGGDITGVDLT